MTNLLPPKEKQILKEERRFQQIIILLAVVGFSIVFGGLILFLINFNLETRILFQEALLAQKKREVEASEIQRLEQEIAGFNQVFNKVNDFYKNQPRLGRILEILSENLPEDCYLLSVEFQAKDSSIRISGFAPTREGLILFRQNLKEEPFFEKVDFPASNWVKPLAVEFFADLKVQNNELKN